MISAVSIADLEKARSEYYGKLASYFLEQINLRSIRTILEAGSGRGQLTIPLIDKLPRRIRLIAMDSSTGPYQGSFEVLVSKLHSGHQQSRVHHLPSDVRRIKGVADNSVDVVISNELLCDLKSETQILKAFREFHRVLRPKGIMVHGEWTSIPDNEAQRITIRADGPEGTDTPSRFWNPDELSSLMRATGFQQVCAGYFETSMSLGYEAAVRELQNWGVRRAFLKRNDRLLRRYGIQLPFEHVIRCQKQSC
ncbi:MAG TPA: class I SAM-dependent methyltransferase [Candidatus Dormibacteraeota bacterium]|jgi:SAM-dependent methyltransferase|nr:class I SAM-dependent methyltransferase [Candidatus Dormibacteraeota bacterium]